VPEGGELKAAVELAAAKLKLPPMPFGWIRLDHSLGRPQGDAASGFAVTIRERGATAFRDRGHGIYDQLPGGWTGPPVAVPCVAAPDEDQMHVVSFGHPRCT
jgi:hypothetical protein